MNINKLQNKCGYFPNINNQDTFLWTQDIYKEHYLKKKEELKTIISYTCNIK